MIIGVHGQKGSGKDEFFKTIKNINDSYIKVAFADRIRETVGEIYGFSTEEEYDEFKRSEFDYHGKKVFGREIVRGIGMLMRGYDDNQFNRYVRGVYWKHDDVIITDVRFDNEIAMLESDAIVLVKIKRDNLPKDGHITEKIFPDERFDYVIDNNGTLEEFHEKIVKTYNKIKEEHDSHSFK